MTDERRFEGVPDRNEESSALAEAARRAQQFSRDYLATVISLVTTALGVVVALAWNTALSEALERLSPGAKLLGLFVYAVAITGLGVLVIMFLGRLAGRLGAQPIEFKYPAPPRE